MQKAHFVPLVTLAALHLCMAANAGADVSAENAPLLNVRLLRTPLAPFEHTYGGVHLTSDASAPMELDGGLVGVWDLYTTISSEEPILAVEALGPNLELLAASPLGSNEVHIVSRVSAPRYCSTNSTRHSFVGVRLSTGVHTVPVDENCLVGDAVRFDSLDDYFSRASTDTSGTVLSIAREVQRAPNAVAATAILHDELLKRGVRFIDDPHRLRGFPASYATYLFSPEATLRFGGDCEDWAVLAAAVLNAAGFRTTVEWDDAHATAAIHALEGTYVVDLSASLPGWSRTLSGD